MPEIREIRDISLVMSQSVTKTEIFSIVKLQKISSQEPTEISKKASHVDFYTLQGSIGCQLNTIFAVNRTRQGHLPLDHFVNQLVTPSTS